MSKLKDMDHNCTGTDCTYAGCESVAFAYEQQSLRKAARLRVGQTVCVRMAGLFRGARGRVEEIDGVLVVVSLLRDVSRGLESRSAGTRFALDANDLEAV